MSATRPPIVGNPWVLAGSVMYLLEWVAIIPAGDSGPADPGTPSARVLALYAAHPTRVAFLAGWISLVLLGRVLLVVGLRSALRSVRSDLTLMSFAVAAMAVSVVLEIVSESFVGAATALADRGASPDLIRAFDAVAGFSWPLIFAPLGVAVAVSAWAMLRCRAFPIWMCAPGLAGGVLLILGGVMSGPAYLHDGAARTTLAVGQAGVPLFWLWMISTGVFLLRRRPRADRPEPAAMAHAA